MKKKNKYIWKIATGWLMSLTLLLVSCSEEYPESPVIGKESVSVNLSLSVPGLTTIGTKAMSTGQEATIDPDKLQILVFEQNGTSETFRYQATITNRSLPQITLKVPAGDSGKKYRFVVLANAEAKTITEGVPKQNALSEFMFSCLGKWNASSTTPTYIPMWGELDQPISIDADKSINILLHRALARVDVGLLFKLNNLDPVTGLEYPQKETDKESVYGIDKFKIKDIRVYRTSSQAYVASLANIVNNAVTAPSIPGTAKYNSGNGSELNSLEEADANPLVYTLPTGANSYIRDIYIPESSIIDSQSNMDNVPCLVIGGYYGIGNTTTLSYYRADFATYNNGAITAFRPILRNHQYVFDIKTVNGPGFETPEQALRSITSPMTLNVVEWNQVPLNFYVQGHYYLNVKEREIWMEARAQADLQVNSYTVPFQTNLELTGVTGKKLDHKWESSSGLESPHFNMEIDYSQKTITFTTKNNNVNTGSGELEDKVILRTENFELEIIVHQKAFSLNYSMACSDIVVKGRYREDIPLNYSNHILVKVVTKGSNMHGESYELKTLEKNGIYFEAKGAFNSVEATSLGGGDFEYTLTLEGYGTPVNESGGKVFEPFEVTIITNSINNDYCKAKIILGYKGKRVLTIGANAAYRYGYMLEPNTAARAFVDASINFGTDPNSTITMEENQYGNAFTIEVMTAGKGMSGEVINYTYLKNILNTFKPEIILTGQAINFNAQDGDAIQLLSDFVDAGGVFLMCNEYYPVAASIQAMVQKIMGLGVIGNNQSIGYNQIFTMNGDADDPLLNGPFGNMVGAKWGADGHEMHGFTNLPSGTKIYSTRTDGAACMFRHETKPFFFMGEGGFISNPQRYIGNSYQGSYVYCPFAIDASYRPVPRINFGLNTNGTQRNETVYNSQIFANILTWAVDFSETSGIEYPATGNKFP